MFTKKLESIKNFVIILMTKNVYGTLFVLTLKAIQEVTKYKEWVFLYIAKTWGVS